MDFTAQQMKGYILIDETGMRDPQDFNFWISLALKFNAKAKASGKKK
jgi:hypothetical protein